MNHAALRKIAAATAVICDENGGSADMFFILKAIYLSDRHMVTEYGAPITGDKYSSMPQGPILCATYDLIKGKFSEEKKLQTEWNEAFTRKENSVTPRGKIDIDSLSPKEEEVIREKFRLVMKLDAEGGKVADWMHKNCPEWEDVPKGSSKPLPLNRMIQFARHLDAEKAKDLEASIREGLLIRKGSAFAKSPLLASA